MWQVSLFRLAVAALMVSAVTAAAVVLAASFDASKAVAKSSTATPGAPPTAAQVSVQLEFATNERAKTSGGGRIGDVSCVAGDPGSYACSYVRTVGFKRTCAVALLLWTPNADSSYEVRTAGRVALAPEKCGPVTKVLHVLGTSG